MQHKRTRRPKPEDRRQAVLETCREHSCKRVAWYEGYCFEHFMCTMERREKQMQRSGAEV